MNKNFYTTKDFPIFEDIIAQVDLIRGELDNAMKHQEVHQLISSKEGEPKFLEGYSSYWVNDNGFSKEQIGYDIRDGEYFAMAIFKKGYPIKHLDTEQFFPNTNQLIQRVPNVYFSAFFRMNAHAILNAHTHTRRHLIFHLLTNDLVGGVCTITVNGEDRILSKKGDYVIFDYSLEHETHNDSDSDRYNFIIDFNPFE